jgi:rhodanese-related sulfurtransferase
MKALIALLIACFTVACGNAQTKQRVQALEPGLFAQKLKESSNPQLFDLRTSEEIAQTGKMENAVHLDFYRKDFAQTLKGYPKDSPIFLYCAGGYRSNEAAKMLVEAGYTQVYDLKGGMKAWRGLGLKTIP